MATSPQGSRVHRHDTCNDQVVGAILSGWRYDISGIPPDLRGDGLTQFLTAGQAVQGEKDKAANAQIPPPLPEQT